MTTLSAPGRGGGPLPHAAARGATLAPATLHPGALSSGALPRGAVLPNAIPRAAPRRREPLVLPRPRSSALGRLLRGISLLLAALALAGFAAVGPLQVLQSSRTATAGYELRTLELQRAELSAGVRLLEAEIARMAKLEALHAAAIEELGMIRREDSVRIAVSVPAPAVVPMPERYVQQLPAAAEEPAPWWDRVLGSLPGLD